MDRHSPYQGLDAFAEEDADFFFGRKRDVTLIVANLFASPLTVLYGPSGVGKTSVLRAGVLPALRERDIVPTVLGSWSGDAADTLRRAVAETTAAAESGDGGRRRTVLVLDQFEDYFLDPPEDQAFAAELARVITQPGRSSSVLVAIREDAVAKLDRFEGRIPRLLDNVLRLDHLDRAAAREAILGPRDTWNARAAPSERFEIDDDLVDAVLDSVLTATGRIETALLQLVMRRLWEASGENGPFVLRRQTFDDLGGLEGIVDRHVTGTLDALNRDQQELAAAILEHLVTPSRLRIAQRTADLAGFAGVDEDELLPLLEELSSDRVLRPVSGLEAGDTRYEVNHDSLADAVLGWRTRFVTAQEVAAERRRFQRRLALTVVAALVLAVLAALATYGWTQRQTARSEALSAEALGLLPIDPVAALEQALKAVEVRSIDRAENALRATIAGSHQLGAIAGPGDAAVTQVDFAPGRRLLTADAGGGLTVRTASGEVVRDFTGLPFVNDAVFCPDASRIAVAVENGALLISRGRQLRLNREPTGALSVSCSRNGSRIVSFNEESARVYSAQGRQIARIDGHELGFIADAAISADGALVVVAGAEDTRVVRAIRGRRIATLDAGLGSVAFSPDGSRIVGGGEGGDVLVWRFAENREPAVLRGHLRAVTDVEFSPNGTLVVSAGTDDRTARLWDAASGEEIAALRGHTGALRSAAFSPDGRTIVTASDDGTARLWETPVISVLAGHTGEVDDVAITPDGTRVATASKDGTVRVWEAVSGRELVRFAAPTARTLAISPNGRRLVTVHVNDGRARLWDIARPRRPIVLRARGPESAAFAPDGSLIATAGEKGAIEVFDLSGRPVRRFRAPSNLDEIGRISFAPQGDRLVVAEVPEGVVVVLVAMSGAEFARLAEPKLRALNVAFSPDGDHVVTGESGGVARIWDAGSGTALPPALAGHDGSVLTASFSPDSTLVVTAGSDATARIWHVATGAELVRHPGKSAAFANEEDVLVIGGPGSTARIYPCRPCGSISALRERARGRRG